MIALAEVIAESKTILRMDIRENEPYVGGLMALSLSLKVNESLVRIDLDKELKKEPVRRYDCLNYPSANYSVGEVTLMEQQRVFTERIISRTCWI